MGCPDSAPLIRTVPERCRVCYTCVRECPAKAIRILQGQAEVLPERCIGCGNCVRVCSQGAKEAIDGIDEVLALLDEPGVETAAIVAPSFPAEFVEHSDDTFVGMLRALGFRWVFEVGFGADIVADRYRDLMEANGGRRTIATTCPAIVSYVERYHPDSVANLAPIVSPMLASARVVHRLHGRDVRVVFIGPCIAKRAEAREADVSHEVSAVLTFAELRRLFDRKGVRAEKVIPDDFDPPRAGLGALFPLTRGMLQAATLEEDLMAGEIVSADGRRAFVEAIREFESGDLEARLLDVLCCDGCIMGPGMTTEDPQFRRRARVSRHVRETVERLKDQPDAIPAERLDGLNLTRSFRPCDRRLPLAGEETVEAILARMGKHVPADELNCGACGYDTCREHAQAIQKGLAESEMCLPFTISELKRTVDNLAESNDELERTQDALRHSERLASMGQLAAGIAHEVNNPLGVVLMYAHILLEEAAADSPMADDLKMIAEQADRCKKIVAGLLNFARQNKVAIATVDVGELVDHVARSLGAPDGVEIVTRHTVPGLDADIDRDQIVQVLTNLARNAVDAMPGGGRLEMATDGDEDDVTFVVRDTGTGIGPDDVAKIFEPFFTTKPVGKGTGLGLSVTYGIVKMHHGDIRVETNADPANGPTGTTFTVRLPRYRRKPTIGADK